MNLEFHPAAEAEHLKTVAHYESIRAGLGTAYLTEFEFAIEAICEAPHRYRVEKEPNIRRIHLKRFPFAILYREVMNETVQILAIAHHRRHPEYWLGRI